MMAQRFTPSSLGLHAAHMGQAFNLNHGPHGQAIYAKGACTVVLNNVTINGVLYNETLDFVKGEAWRGQKAQVTLDPLPVYANKTLRTPSLFNGA